MSIKYTSNHEWPKIEGDIATVGLTHHAQDALGAGWFFRIKLANPAQVDALLDEAAYKDLTA